MASEPNAILRAAAADENGKRTHEKRRRRKKTSAKSQSINALDNCHKRN